MRERPVRLLLAGTAIFLSLAALLLHPLGALLPALAGTLLLAATVFALGRLLLDFTRVSEPSPAISMAVGWMATGAFFFLASALHGIGLPLLGAFLALPPILAMATGRKAAFWKEAVRGIFALPGSSLTAWSPLLLPLVYAALPATFYDTLVYHLGIPNQIIQWGGFVPTPYHLYANSSIYHEVAMIPAVLLGDRVPQLFHLVLGACLIRATVDFAREKLALERTGLVAVGLLSLPMTSFLLASQKNDLVSALFVLLAVLHWQDRPRLAALFWGFALGVKSFNTVPLLAFFLVSPLWRHDERGRWLTLGAIVPLVLAPLLVKNLLLTGNPIYPFLSGLFPAASWDAVRQAAMQHDVGAAVGSLAELARFPFELLYRSYGFGGLVGPLPLAFLPFLLLDRQAGERRTLAFALLTLLLATPLTASMRFVFVAFVVLVPWTVRALKTADRRWLWAPVVLLVGLGFVQGFTLLETLFPARAVLAGELDTDAYIASRFPAYPVFRATADLPRTSRILLVGEARNFYLERPYALSSALDWSIIRPFMQGKGDAGDFLARVRQAGFTHLLVNTAELRRLQAVYGNLTAEEEGRFLGFSKNWQPQVTAGATALYDIDRLLGSPAPEPSSHGRLPGDGQHPAE